ncbi:hypothetical protein [Nocardioides pantholopis]|uniref:hypothetical protein n=1 Tax=Nocardioides pantholopis TaxID=2483798 RepID=UPI001F1531B3|nr:hypothetical protein [Nocardioides pantholopis]
MSLPPSSKLIADGIIVDLDDAQSAPSLDEAPVSTGLLLAQLSLEAANGHNETRVPPGQPYLLTQRGQWRTFDLAGYGFASPVYGELSMAISSDGSHVAFADPSALVTVDLADNTFKRFELAAREAIMVTWSPDEASLLLKDRHDDRRPCGPTGCRLDLETGRLTPVPFNMFHSAYNDNGAVIEIQTPSRGRVGHVVTHHADGSREAVPMPASTVAYTAGGPAAARHVAYAQCGGRAGRRDTGVAVLSTTSGSALSMLTAPHLRGCRLGARTWLDDHHLVVDDWMSGDMWLWDAKGKTTHQLVESRTPSVNYDVAGTIMTKRFRHLLTP